MLEEKDVKNPVGGEMEVSNSFDQTLVFFGRFVFQAHVD